MTARTCGARGGSPRANPRKTRRRRALDVSVAHVTWQKIVRSGSLFFRRNLSVK